MAEPALPGTMIAPQSDPWDAAFAQYRQALVDLNGDGVPDAVIQTGDTRPPQAFDPDGRPRVPASGGANPYPFPAGAYPPNPTMLERVQNDPVGNAIMPAFGGAMNALAATGDAMGPTGMPMSMLGRMGAAAVRTPGAAIGRGPGVPFQIEKAREALAPLAAAESRAGMAMPMPRPMSGAPDDQVLNSLLRDLTGLEKRAPAVRNALATKLDEFNAQVNATASGTGPRALSYSPDALADARAGGMVNQYRPDSILNRAGVVAPEADPSRIAAAYREAEALSRGQFRMQRQAEAAAEAASPTNQLINRDLTIDQTMQNMLGAVARNTGVPPDQLARLPRGQFERFLANEPGLSMLMQQYGMTLDDIISALGSRGYAVPPRAPFNANVMQQFQSGRSGALPMTAEEKALRDAMHRRNRTIGGAGQGDAF